MHGVLREIKQELNSDEIRIRLTIYIGFYCLSIVRERSKWERRRRSTLKTETLENNKGI